MLRGRPHQDHRESNRYGRHQPAKDMHPLDSANEAARLSALHSLDLLDTPPEPAFDSLVQLVALACDTPIALVSLVDRTRQWFKARVGIEATETPREYAFCAHAILTPGGLIVPDAARDPRFAPNPLVTDSPGIRFYAGVPIRVAGGHAVGVLCVVDTVPRTFTARQLEMLRALARQAERLIVLHCEQRAATALRQRLRGREQQLRQLEIHEASRIAAELHDGLGQQLTGISLAVASLQARLQGCDEATQEQATTIGMLASEAIRQCRDLAYSEATFTVDEHGLVGFLQRYCRLLNQGPGAPITLHTGHRLAREPDAATAHHLFRLVQEAVNNARRHSGATHIGIELIEQPDLLSLTIDDDGRGMCAEARSFPGLGIRSMRFRAMEIGAKLVIADRHYGGTQVRCVLPLRSQAVDSSAAVRTVEAGLRRG